MWNEKKSNNLIEFYKKYLKDIKLLFSEWIMWALNLAENPIKWNKLNPANNWWYFQVI
jgi:hypothetical protein